MNKHLLTVFFVALTLPLFSQNLSPEQMSSRRALGLLGDVKSVVYSTGVTYEFNEDGELITGREYLQKYRFKGEYETFNVLFLDGCVRYETASENPELTWGHKYTFDKQGRIKSYKYWTNYIEEYELIYRNETDALPYARIDNEGDEEGHTTKTFKYEYLKTDARGNWTERKVTTEIKSEEYTHDANETVNTTLSEEPTYIETAMITYYSADSAAPVALPQKEDYKPLIDIFLAVFTVLGVLSLLVFFLFYYRKHGQLPLSGWKLWTFIPILLIALCVVVCYLAGFSLIKKPVLQRIKLDKESIALDAHATNMLNVQLEPADVKDVRLVWYSSDPAVAIVDSEGQVRAVKEGNAVIEVSTADGLLKAECRVLVLADGNKSNLTPPPTPPTSGNTLRFSWGTYVGEIKNGKMHGEGTLRYTQTHIISQNDMQNPKRSASPGDYIVGRFYEGEVDNGQWFNSRGELIEKLIWGH